MKNCIAALFLVLGCLLFSCTIPKNVYSPATANLLVLEKKNDIKIATNVSKSSLFLIKDSRHSTFGIDIQAGYAISKKVGFKADVYKKWESNQSALQYNELPKYVNTYEKKGIEISGGIFNFSKNGNQSVVQVFGGAGAGSTSFKSSHNADIPERNYHSMEYVKFFIQPSLTFKPKKNYWLSIATRLSSIQFENISTDFPDLSNEPLGYIDTKPSLYADLIIQNEFGFNQLKGIRFQVQHGRTHLFTKFSSTKTNGFKDYKYDYNDSWFALGLIVNLKEVFKSQN
jgi:hypothetical protein